MPITPTFPGVYIEEIASGVRTITGVATSVTAFVGATRRGPINRAVRLLGFGDFERRFGGLSDDSELSYAVRQFFENGGSEAWVVRVAGAPATAVRNLTRGAANVLEVKAADAGSAGNAIRLTVAGSGGSNFTLTARYTPPDNPSDTITETFDNVSMNSADARWVESYVNTRSSLIQVRRVAAAIPAATKGKVRSARLVAADNTTPLTFEQVIDDTHNQFRISANGGAPVTIIFPSGLTGTLGDLKDKILDLVHNAVDAGYPALKTMTGAVTADNRIELTSDVGGEASMVRVLPGLASDASARLRFGLFNGGEDIDAAESIRPDEGPGAGKFTSGAIADADVAALPSAAANTLRISVDGGTPEIIAFPPAPVFGTVATAVQRLQQAVRDKRPDLAAFRDFVARVNAGKIELLSGSRGAGSSVAVLTGTANDIAAGLKMTAGTTAAPGLDISLAGGAESPIDNSNRYTSFIGSRSGRTGIYALEEIDLFNILCLPGITDPGVLSDTVGYCVERRAFLIIDPPPAQSPAQMETVARSTALPKNNYAAVYYPWVRIADPLRGGALRTSAPCGTVAGVYARTDSTRGVWKAPAGTEASLRGVQAVDYQLTDPENGILNPRGVNCLRILPPFGAVAWGARTLQGDDDMGSEWKYVPVRRLALFIEESLFRGTKWVVFEPNDEPLWAQIRLNVGSFMQDLFRQGAFQGRSPSAAYLVKCDKETTTQSDINNGRVNILVGFAPLKPAEFVFIRIQQLAGQIQT